MFEEPSHPKDIPFEVSNTSADFQTIHQMSISSPRGSVSVVVSGQYIFFSELCWFWRWLSRKRKPEQTSPLSPALEKLLLPSKKNSDPAKEGLSECKTWPYANTSHTWTCCRGAVTTMTLPSETHAYWKTTAYWKDTQKMYWHSKVLKVF